MKKVEFITESEVLYGNNTWLKNRLSVDENDKDNGYIQDLFIDCDYLKYDNYTTLFITVENKSKVYIISSSELEKEEMDTIEWFLKGATGDLCEDNSWKFWEESVKTGVAFRGGGGYCYSIYAKELN